MITHSRNRKKVIKDDKCLDVEITHTDGFVTPLKGICDEEKGS